MVHDVARIAAKLINSYMISALCLVLEVAQHQFVSAGKSDYYCFITIVKPEHFNMISTAKHDVVKINEAKHLGLKIEQCKVSQKPTWNQDFIL